MTRVFSRIIAVLPSRVAATILSRVAAKASSPRRKPWVVNAPKTSPSPARGERTLLSPLTGRRQHIPTTRPTARAVGYFLTPLAEL